jgi:hypothetical protein
MWIIAANELSVHRSPPELKARDASKANNALGISHLTNGKVPGI